MIISGNSFYGIHWHSFPCLVALNFKKNINNHSTASQNNNICNNQNKVIVHLK